MFRRSEEQKAEQAKARVELTRRAEEAKRVKDELRAYVKDNLLQQVATFKDVHAFPDSIIRIPSFGHSGVLGSFEPAERHPIAGVEAVVDLAGGIAARTTLARTVVLGAHAWQKKIDTREVWLLITGDKFQWLIEVEPMLGKFARQFAAKVTGAGNAARSAAPSGDAVASSAPASRMDELRKLAELRDAGVVDEAEFQTEKARILGS